MTSQSESDRSDEHGETEDADEEEEYEESSGGEDGADPGADDSIPNELTAEIESDKYIQKYMEVHDISFDEAYFPQGVIAEAQGAWNAFITQQNGRDAAGEAIYAAVFDAAPSLQSLFKTARSVMAMRFMNGLTSIVAASGGAQQLKNQVESLGFQHLDLEVTVPRVGIFRDAIVDLFEMEMGQRFTSKAKVGLQAILNYSGGAYIYIRREYASRIRIIQRSWKTANKSDESEEDKAPKKASLESDEHEGAEADKADKDKPDAAQAGESGWTQAGSQKNVAAKAATTTGEGAKDKDVNAKTGKTAMKVPTSFNEMFLFNAAVMGLGDSSWMSVILEQFHNIVTNVANSYRLQEECDVLALVLDKQQSTIHLSEFKAVMLASLRSLVPKEWDSEHEVAWNWLWENVERMIQVNLGKPAAQEKALSRLIASLSADDIYGLRKSIYQKFFQAAPAGQDHFKQSTTRLYFIADKIIEMTMEMYQQPRVMVEDISALGLRHVGYAIPTELFAPFVSCAVEVVRGITTDDVAEGAFRWSLTLISKILVRTILEGSTIVMKAINTNSARALRKAIAIAPRSKRAMELLNITVGTQSISPFYWAIDSGSHECAKAMIEDLFTIRADRESYYYGADPLFTRHPEVIQRLCNSAPHLLWSLLDGLVWRSRQAFLGRRRVNYYVQNMVQDQEGKFNMALEWLVERGDPKVICHPCVVIFSDLLWSRLAQYNFLLSRCYFLFSLCVFIIGQAILGRKDGTEGERIATFVCRIFIYLGSMCRILYSQIKMLYDDMKHGAFDRRFRIPIPMYLFSTQDGGSLVLFWVLLLMLIQEPILHCMAHTEQYGLFATSCADPGTKEAYAVFSGVAMLLYWLLLMNFSIFSMQISAFVLVCGRVLAEVMLFLLAFVFLVIAFSTAITALHHRLYDFERVDRGMETLLEITLGMYPLDNYKAILAESIYVEIAIIGFTVLISVLLLNLLVAQLNMAYKLVHSDMQGYARLTRGGIIVSTVEQVSRKRWDAFLQSLHFEERLEFNEGDIGLSGGIQVFEPANANPTTVETVRRFGGSTAPNMPWPEDPLDEANEDRLEKLEKLVVKAMKTITDKKGGGGAGQTGMSGISGMPSSASGSGMSSNSSQNAEETK
ncbi:unnamed protein product [Effrenium voratum]|uniref:Uncharacterized protein n=1 Tax=Effrenium voratum TaxID=2562239 RepID=A0AA36NCE8_9DINO|nr:unnamed protein product [Effrenium voratum]CAJ1432108.1 unnamed protein product [Effrenium voratum]